MKHCHKCEWEQSEEIIEDNEFIILSHFCLNEEEAEAIGIDIELSKKQFSLFEMSQQEKKLYKRVSNTSVYHKNNRYVTFFGLCLYKTSEDKNKFFVEGYDFYFKSEVDREDFVKSIDFKKRDFLLTNNPYKGIQLTN